MYENSGLPSRQLAVKVDTWEHASTVLRLIDTRHLHVHLFPNVILDEYLRQPTNQPWTSRLS
jgi:hypothetical protein